MKEVMMNFNVFEWDLLDGLIAGAASRFKHVAMSFYIHWPYHQDSSQQLPDFLVESVDMLPTKNDGTGASPDYQNADLLVAMEQLTRALGRRYDGDKRILTVHISLVGFW
jgi:hypothetical protein